MAALREIEHYRKTLAERVRERSDNAIIDGEFSEAAPRPTSGGGEGARTDSTRTDGAMIDSVESVSAGNESLETQGLEADSARTEGTKTESAKPDRAGMRGDPA
jgi:hypothetical protein